MEATTPFCSKIKPLNIKYFCVNSRLSISQKYDVLISHVNSIKQTGKFSVRSVWLTWPPIVFLGGLKKISDVQISWHMKYPFSLGHSYDYCLYPYGLNSNDATFNLHDQFEPIISHKFYLTDSALQSEGNTEGQGLARTLINKIKSRQLQVVLSVARPEKLNNLKFLHSLKILLSSNPRLCFCWCGKKTDAAVSQLLKKFLKLEIKNQFFLGWVDSWEAVSECDYFIDSYPFGSGITLAQALRLQKPIIVFSSEKKYKSTSVETRMVEEPNFSSSLIQNNLNSKNLIVLDIDNHEAIRDTRLNASNIENYDIIDPFEPNSKDHQRLINLLLGEHV